MALRASLDGQGDKMFGLFLAAVIVVAIAVIVVAITIIVVVLHADH